MPGTARLIRKLSLIHISEPTRLLSISYAVFCLKKKNHHVTQPRTHRSGKLHEPSPRDRVVAGNRLGPVPERAAPGRDNVVDGAPTAVDVTEPRIAPEHND